MFIKYRYRLVAVGNFCSLTFNLLAGFDFAYRGHDHDYNRFSNPISPGSSPFEPNVTLLRFFALCILVSPICMPL